MIADVRMKLVCWCLLSIRFIYTHQFSDAIIDSVASSSFVDESFITPSVVADYYQHLFELLLTSAPPHEEYSHREGSQSSSVIGSMRMMTEFCVLVVEYDVIHGVHRHRHHQQRLKHHQQHNQSSSAPPPPPTLLSHLLHSSEVLKKLLGLSSTAANQSTYTTTAISLRPSINTAATNATATASTNAASSGNSAHHHHHHHHNVSAFITSICRCYFQLVQDSFSEVLNFVLSLEHLHRFDSSTISPSPSSTAGINDGLTSKFLTAIMFLDAFITSSSSSLS